MLWSFGVFAGDAIFTWTKPVPAFDVSVPAGTVIDEYRIHCTVGASNFVIVVSGYDTEQYDATGLVPGSHTCYMTSWSVGANAESVDSESVTKTIFDASSPNPPAFFDFVPAIE